MPYKVRIIKGPPEYDALPVAKVTSYPLEKRDYRPFAQNVLCFGEDALFLRMWAFEASPCEGSEIRGVFYMFADKPGTALHVRAAMLEESSPAPYVEAYICSNGVRGDGIQISGIRPHSGEDLQGIYWGASVSISFGDLRKSAGGVLEKPGDFFGGNFYKTCTAKEQEHYGGFYPADFIADPYGEDSMDRFEVIDF